MNSANPEKTLRSIVDGRIRRAIAANAAFLTENLMVPIPPLEEIKRSSRDERDELSDPT